MKTFVEYLTESRKTYKFKIKVAGDLGENFNADLKAALDKFSVVKLSSGKRTPIQEVPLDFPDTRNSHVTIYEAEIGYPTTPQVLTDYIVSCCKCTHADIKVRGENEPTEAYQQQKTEGGDDSAQDQVGQKRVSDFIKELAAEAKMRSCEGQPREVESKMPEPGPAVSPIGSKVQKGK